MSTTNQNDDNNGSNEITVGSEGVSVKTKSTLALIVILILLIIVHGILNYNVKDSWSYDAFKTDKKQKIALQELHKPVS